MKINSVELENYRIHKNVKFEFGNGINLILGKNGAGKSSILEAIGMALFGADTRTTDKEAVRNGEKSSYICIEITGNDGIEYIVEKKIGNTSQHRVYPKDNKSEAVTGVENVIAKIAEISGIEKNSKKIYQNVITAYQNKIVNIFGETAKNRETLFNEIFDTAIYREMYQGYLKTALDKYTIEKKIIENDISALSVVIEDTEIIEKDIKEKKEVEKEKEKEYKKVKEEFERVEKEIKSLEKAKQDVERLEREIKDRKSMIDENNRGIEKNEIEIIKAEESADIVKKSEEEYKSYILTEKEITEYEKEITVKESIKKEIEKAEKRVEEENRKKVEISTLKSEKSEKMRELAELKDKSEKRVFEREENIKEFSENLKIIRRKVKERKTVLEKGEEYLFLYEKLEKESNESINKIKIMEDSVSNIDDIDRESEAVEEQIKELKIKFEKKKELENSLKEYDIKSMELKRAGENSRGGNCPYLKESCLNIRGKIGFEDYFKIRIEEIEKKRAEKAKELEEFAEIELKLEKKNGEKGVLLQKRESCKKAEAEIKELKIKIEFGAERKENILLKTAVEINSSSKIRSYEELKKEVKEINMNLVSELKEIEEKEKREVELKEEIEVLKSENREIKERAEKNREELEKLNEDEKSSLKIIGIAEQFIREKSEKTADLEQLKSKNMELKKQREEKKKGYELYSSNIKTAMSLEEVRQNREILIKSRDKKIKEVAEKAETMIEISGNFKFEKIDEIIEDKNRISEIKEKLSEELTESRIEIGKSEERAAENQRKSENLKEKKKKLKKFEKKIEITQKFRDNINTMGKAVAAGLLSSIEKMATENFRRMTGRDEEINWINGEKESYAVYLNGKERGNTRFEVLSGGEQVAAALSIRAAMASTLTTANFAIFDEPTINLDKIRKEALAESLKEILKDLEQAIIVTHDDLFEEMAERIIIVE